MRWNLAYLNRAAAERELKAKGKSLKDYPWPEDAAPEFAGSRTPKPVVPLPVCPCVPCVSSRFESQHFKAAGFDGEHDHGQFQYCRCNPNRNRGN